MVQSKRLVAAELFSKLGLAWLFLRLRSRRRKEVRILTYHRVVDLSRAYDLANVSATPEEFDRQLAYLKKNYDLIRFSDLIEIANGTMSCPRRPLILTFDDGYMDNYEFAFPILKSHGLSAAFFVSTSHIGSNQLFWFEELGFIMRKTKKQSWTLLDGSSIEIPETDRGPTLKRLLKLMKDLPNEARVREIEHLRVESEAFDPEKIDAINFPMNWEHLVEMHNNGMDILSHSHTHPILSTLETYEQVEGEISTPKKLIEENIKANCPVIAYPVGRWDSYDERVLKAVQDAGYELACVYENGVNEVPFDRKFELKRTGIDNFHQLDMFASIVACPEVFTYCTPRPAGNV
tara:strand:+ start:1551 stop:2594 length:1044 start_codon:yes stop_codon:yes gene_type:complete